MMFANRIRGRRMTSLGMKIEMTAHLVPIAFPASGVLHFDASTVVGDVFAWKPDGYGSVGGR